MAKTILVTGPESSGKTTLAKNLAATLADAILVPEAAREYLYERDGRYDETDLPKIWEHQRATEDAARASNAKYVVCDTGPEVIHVWAEVKYGRVPPEVARATEERNYDLTLLCYPDLPWEADPLREAPAEQARLALFFRYAELLEGYVLIRGEDRLRQAYSATTGTKPAQ